MQHRLQLSILLAASSLTIMAATAVVPALPLMRDRFGQTAWSAWLAPFCTPVPGLAVALSSPFAGMIADRIDRARLLAVGLALYVVSGASGLLLESLEFVVLWRVLLGVAVACIMTC